MVKTAQKGKSRPIPKIKISLHLPAEKEGELLEILRVRFEQNMPRHSGLEWPNVHAKLASCPDKLASLHAMEVTGGEPDVVGLNKKADKYLFYDCSPESPVGRRNICYDGEGQAEREKKGVFPAGNAIDLAASMGFDLLDEDGYRKLQQLGEFDTKTSSWIQTPTEIRALGGAIFADRRYDHVFIYHNSAPSFYSTRGFRGSILV